MYTQQRGFVCMLLSSLLLLQFVVGVLSGCTYTWHDSSGQADRTYDYQSFALPSSDYYFMGSDLVEYYINFCTPQQTKSGACSQSGFCREEGAQTITNLGTYYIVTGFENPNSGMVELWYNSSACTGVPSVQFVPTSSNAELTSPIITGVTPPAPGDCTYTVNFMPPQSWATASTAPSTITGLSSVVAGNNRMAISWTENGAASYYIYRSEVSGGPYTRVGSAVTSPFLDTNVYGGITYYYIVRGVIRDESPRSAETSNTATGDAGPPKAPSRPTLQQVSTGIKLTWTAGAVRFGGTGAQEIYRTNTLGGQGQYTKVNTLSATATTYTDTSAPAGFNSYYVLFTETASNKQTSASGSKNIFSVPAAPNAPAQPTTQLSTANGAMKVTVSWSAVSAYTAVTGYTISRSIDGGAYTTVGTSTTGLTYEDTVTVNGSYKYKVAATNSAGTGSASPESAALIVNPPPQAVADTLTVNANSAATNVDVLANDSGDTGETLSVTAVTQPSTGGTVTRSGNTVSFTPSSDFVGTTKFNYTVSDGTSNATATVTVTVNAVVPPAPAAPTLAQSVVSNTLRVTVSWTAPAKTGGAAITQYTVKRSADGVSYSTVGTTATLTYADTSVVSHTTYYYKVAATNSVGNSADSAASSSIYANYPPTATDDNYIVIINAPATTYSVLSNDAITPDTGETITITAVTQPTGGSVTFTPTTVTFTPTNGFTGNAVFTYTISDSRDTDTATVTVLVSAAVPPKPAAPTLSQATPSGATIVTVTWVNPSNAQTATITQYTVFRSTDGTSFTQVGTTTGAVTYDDATVVSHGTYYYKVSATNSVTTGAVSDASSSIYVNAPPNGVDDSYNVDMNSAAQTFSVLNNDNTTPDTGETLTITAVTQPTNGGTVTFTGTAVTFTPTNNFVGTATFTYTVSDSRATDTATVTVTVHPIAPAKPAAPTLSQATPSGATIVTITWVAPSSIGSAITQYKVKRSSDGTTFAQVGTSSTLTWADSTVVSHGTYYYKVSATNSVGTSVDSDASASIFVNAPPTATDDTVKVYNLGSPTILKNLLANDVTTPDSGETLTITAIAQPANGGSVAFTASSVTFTPTAGYTGSTTFSYTISDGNGMSDSADVTVHVVVPTITACNGQGAVVQDANKNNTEISVCGTDLEFGAVMVADAVCVSTSVTATKIECVVPIFAGKNVPVFIYFGAVSKPAGLTITFPNPIVTSVSPSSIGAGRTRAVKTTLTITGANFGPADSFYLQTHRNIQIGQFPCTNIVVISPEKLTCDVYDLVGSNLAVSAVVGGLANVLHVSPIVDTSVISPADSGCSFPAGTKDVYSDLCNCFSGYAPLDTSFADCLVDAKCPGRVMDTAAVGLMPSSPTTKFANDVLLVQQTAPIVKGRRDYHISFNNAGNQSADTCNYPSNIWQKTVSKLDCNDVFTLALPWSQNELCGFEFVNDATHRIYKTYMTTTYRDLIKGRNGATHFRASTVSHLITVKFQRQLIVVSHSNTVLVSNPTDSSIDVVITSNVVQDVDTNLVILSFETTVSPSFKIPSISAVWSTTNTVPAGGAVSVVVTAAHNGDQNCMSFSQECVQQWVMQLDNNNGTTAVCDLAGKITLHVDTFLCRESGSVGACAFTLPAISDIDLTLAKTELCDDIEVDATTGLDVQLSSYNDMDFQDAQTVFSVGSEVHFTAVVVDPTSSIDSITFNSVTIDGSGNTVTLYDLTNGNNVAANFNVTNELVASDSSLLPPNVPAVLSFKFKVNRALTVLSGLSTADVPLSVTVVVDIQYHGNSKKRTVVVDQYQKEATASLVIAAGAEAQYTELNQEAEQLEDWDFGFGSSASVITAPLLLIALVFVFLM